MAKNRSAAGITNIVQYDANRNITFVSGSTTLLTVSSSGALTTSGTITAQTLVVQTVTSSVNFITGSTKFGSLSSNTHTFTGSLAVTGGINLNSGSLLIGTNSPIWTNGTTRGVVEINGPSQALLGFDIAGSGAGYLYHDGTNMTLNNGLNGYLRFLTNGVENVRITSGGDVGIGTSTIYYASTNRRVLEINGTSSSFLAFKVGDVAKSYLFQNGADFIITNLAAAGGYLALENNGGERMRITSGGNVLVGGTSDTGNKMQVYGSFGSFGSGAISLVQARDLSTQYGWYADNSTYLYFYNTLGGNVTGQFTRATGVYTALSDINKKKDIEESKIGLNEILALKPTLYRMKEDADTSEKHLGFIAQEVKEHIPQAYVESGEFIGLTDRPIIAALVKAIQELKSQNDSLQSQINELKA